MVSLQDLDGEGDGGHEDQEAEDGAADDLAARDLVEKDGLAQGDAEGLFDVVEASGGVGRGGGPSAGATESRPGRERPPAERAQHRADYTRALTV